MDPYIQSGAPTVFAILWSLAEPGLAVVLLLGGGAASRLHGGRGIRLRGLGCGEGLGGPYTSGTTGVDIGIVYTMMFVALLVFGPRPGGSASASTGSSNGERAGGGSSPSYTGSTGCTGRRRWSR